MKISTLVALAFALVCAALAGANPIQYKTTVNGNTSGATDLATSGNTISLNALSGDTVVHIFDAHTASNPLPADSPTGTITITGSTNGYRLVVFVGSANEVVTYGGLLDPTTPYAPGVVNLPGLTVQDTALRDASTLIAWIGNATAGSITGPIEVGQVWAIDAPNDILNDIAARASDADTLDQSYAIKRIRAGNKISGNIIAGDANPAVAADPDDGSTLGTRESSIDTIIAGPSLTSEGITGHIIARRGKIGSIFTTGKLGTSASVRSKVEAGRGIGRIRAIDESGSELVNNTDVGNNFFADVKNAALPVLSYLGPATAMAMTGSFVVERVFNVPGLGQHFVEAVRNKDLFMIIGVVMVFATMLILFNLLVDVLYRWVDPRIQ